MPKVIENIKEQILEIAKQEILEKGYNDVDLRGIAQKCSIAVGTIYNYFPSKLELATTILLEDWMETSEKMLDDIKYAKDFYEGLREIFDELADFSIQFEEILGSQVYIQDENKKGLKGQRRIAMEKSLEEIIKELLAKFNKSVSDFELSFIAEVFLFYVVKRDFSYSKLDNVIRKIIEK